MPLTDIIRRASSYILGPEMEAQKDITYEDNEILFCKNNVCVHPPAMVRQDTDILHNPGYLTITTKVFVDQYNDSRRPTLFLTWIPNTALAKNSNSLQNGISLKKRSSLESLTSNDSNEFTERPLTIELKNTNPFLHNDDKDRLDTSESSGSEDSEKQGISINVDISNPEIEIIQTPDSVKDPREHFEFSRLAINLVF